jgi:hypothetical protein
LKKASRIVVFLFWAFLVYSLCSPSNPYCWLEKYKPEESLSARISVPDGYDRITLKTGTFAKWLRHLPLKKGKPAVYLFNGQKKTNQDAHYSVVDIDVGNRDLQQCADAIIRLRAEYLYSRKKYSDIHFRFTSGHEAELEKWIQGFRPRVKGDQVLWVKSVGFDKTYKNFKKYLSTVFMYAGTHSLFKELKPVGDMSLLQIGDVFIQPGFPGHAVLVVDMALNKTTGKKVFLLAQSYMPAQEIHILKNPVNSDLNPWYELNFGENLKTPEWNFHKSDLKRFF